MKDTMKKLRIQNYWFSQWLSFLTKRKHNNKQALLRHFKKCPLFNGFPESYSCFNVLYRRQFEVEWRVKSNTSNIRTYYTWSNNTAWSYEHNLDLNQSAYSSTDSIVYVSQRTEWILHVIYTYELNGRVLFIVLLNGKMSSLSVQLRWCTLLSWWKKFCIMRVVIQSA